MIARPDVQDCVIIGGGPAGLTAALYLARFLRSVTVFDAQGGRARLIPKTHNLAPFPDGISGRELLDRMQTHAEYYDETRFRTEAMTSRIAQLAIIDALIACIALSDYDRAVENITRTFETLSIKRI